MREHHYREVRVGPVRAELNGRLMIYLTRQPRHQLNIDYKRLRKLGGIFIFSASVGVLATVGCGVVNKWIQDASHQSAVMSRPNPRQFPFLLR